MRQIREILRLKHQCQLSVREIGGSCGLPSSTVSDYLQRAKAAGIGWPLPEDLTEERLQEQLLVKEEISSAPAVEVRPLPDWKQVHEELKRRGVTLQLLWKEYRHTHPEGYGYSRYCELYHAWADTLDPVLRQVHLPGEKMFVDWAGQTVPIHNSQDGTVSEGHVFIGVLGFSNKIFAEAFPDEQLPSWITAHCHAYAYMDGVAKITVPDNPKTGVIRPCRYEPLLHRTYQEMAEHYGTVVIPARPRKPRDKGKRVAVHVRSNQPGRHSTLEEHRPKSHQRHLEWTPNRIQHWAATIGPQCAQLVKQIMESRPHPERGFRSALGIIRLGKRVGQTRLEAACRRALHYGSYSYRSVESILQNHLENQPLEQELPLNSPPHSNLRGGQYYNSNPELL